jgi:ABC-type amino acid transport substrate-binding protein
VVVLLAGAAVWASFGSVVPQWAFDRKPVYLGERIPFAWTYKQAAASAPVHFEVESGVAGRFKREICTDADHYFVDRINATREWRVRAVADCDSRNPVSRWSHAIEITQYDSIYQRIKSRGQIDIFVSNSQDQDFFKWGDQGFDIDLARVLVRDLSARMGRELKLALKPVVWEQLLPAADNQSADLAISSITKTSWREKKFAIQFTDSYYCTSYALMYRAGTPEGRILDMIKDRLVGVQRETTSANLVDSLAAGGLFKIEPFSNNESMQSALTASKIEFGVTDTAFAQAAQLSTRLSTGEDRIKFREFGPDDLPSTQVEQTQEYAIAVHKGEIELLGAINRTLAKAKQDGELARLFKTAAEKYEAARSYQPGSRSLGERPWECFAQTARSN